MTAKPLSAAPVGKGGATPVPAQPGVDTPCMACGHDGAAHDRIAQRYCDATIEHATTRNCICPV